MQNIVIVGATSRMAELCARHWATQGANILLAGRNRAHLDTIAQDLRVRGAATADWVMFDADERQAPAELLADAKAKLSRVDIVLIAHGWLPDQYLCENDLDLARRALEVNGMSACLVAEAFAGLLEKQRAGRLAIIGSVAGDRGRQSNYIYGAAKGLVDRYAQGLRNRLYPHGVTVTLIKPGPTDTPMTTHLREAGARLAPVKRVVLDIITGIDRGRGVVYTPWLWRIIMGVIVHIPEFVFKRLKL
jgi:short-subunit dehydrogenase